MPRGNDIGSQKKRVTFKEATRARISASIKKVETKKKELQDRNRVVANRAGFNNLFGIRESFNDTSAAAVNTSNREDDTTTTSENNVEDKNNLLQVELNRENERIGVSEKFDPSPIDYDDEFDLDVDSDDLYVDLVDIDSDPGDCSVAVEYVGGGGVMKDYLKSINKQLANEMLSQRTALQCTWLRNLLEDYN